MVFLPRDGESLSPYLIAQAVVATRRRVDRREMSSPGQPCASS